MRAMVLAAGLGTRLRPLTETMPKALVPVAGRPMIEYPLRMLAAAGVTEVVVNLHHLGGQVRDALGDGSRMGLRIRYSEEDPILDTGGGIARARRWLDGDDFFVANCDALLDMDLRDLAAFHARSGAIATLVVRRDPEAERYGPVDLARDGRIRRLLGEPPGAPGDLERTMFTGVHRISPAIFDHMPASGVFSITRDTYLGALRAGTALFGYRYDGYWLDLGTPGALDRAREDIESGRFRPSYVPREGKR